MSDGVDLIVNGKPVHVRGDGTTPLLQVLRNELGLRGSRFGCGTEQCGACMVLIDGEPSFSCARPIETPARATARMIRLCTPQRQRWRSSAAAISLRLGRGLRASSAAAEIRMPERQ